MKNTSSLPFHPFHVVDSSPWPILCSVNVFSMALGMVKWFHFLNFNLLILGIFGTFLVSFSWWRDVSREATFQGQHTLVVLKSMQLGMILFIASEVMFFFSFFWSFFHTSLSPVFSLGGQWPPESIITLDPSGGPLLNTIILLASGVTVTWSHFSILSSEFFQAKLSLFLTILLGVYFTRVQVWEYSEISFSIADSVFGSLFFVSTGFHGLHILVGTLFLSICLLRMMNCHFSSSRHFGFEAAAWYWHFVDIVWLFLFSFIYWWGG